MAVEGAAALSAADEEGGGADRRGLSGRDQHAAGEARAVRPVRRGGGQGRGQPHLAQGEGGLGGLVPAQPGRRGHRPSDPGRHGGARRLDRKATSISLLAASACAATGRRCCLSIRNMGGESKRGLARVSSTISIARGLKRARVPHHRRRRRAGSGAGRAVARWCPSSAAPSTSIATCWPTRPRRLHEELTADYTDMIYAETADEIEARRKAFLRKWRLKCRAVADSLEEAGERLFTFTRLDPVAMEIGADDQRDRAAARGVQAPDQDPDRAALRRDRAHAVLGVAGVRPDHDAQGRRLADPFSARSTPPLDLAA